MSDTLIPYAHLPRLDRSEVRLLWHSGFWDGPINGLCLFQGRKCWFEMCEDGASYRRFLVLELTAEELADEERWHALFREHVGTHTDYGTDEAGVVHLRERWAAFYEPFGKRPRVDYSRNPAVGWFEVP